MSNEFKLVPVELLTAAVDKLCAQAMDLWLSGTLENGQWADGEEAAREEHDSIRRVVDALAGCRDAAPAVQGEPAAWLDINDLPNDPDDDQLFWFARADRYIEGPREVQEGGYDLEEFEYFCPCEPPPLYAAPQPAEQRPDVEALVEALEAIQKASTIKGIHTGAKAGLALGRIEAICYIALQAAHRKGGEV